MAQEDRTAEAETAPAQHRPTVEDHAKEKPSMSDLLPIHPALFTEAGISGRPIPPAMFHVETEDSSTVRGSAISLLQLTTEATVPVHHLNLCPAPANHAQYTATGVDGASGRQAQLRAVMESSRGRGIVTLLLQRTAETSARECRPNRRLQISLNARSMESGLPGANGLSAASPAAILVRHSERDTARLLNHNTADAAAKEKDYRLNHV